MPRYRWVIEGEMPRPSRASALRTQLQTILDLFSNGHVQVVECEEIPSQAENSSALDFPPGTRKFLIVAEDDTAETVRENRQAL